MDDGNDVECEPGARHDDEPSRIARRTGVSRDVVPVGLAAFLDRSRSRRSPPWLTGTFAYPRQRIGMGLHGNLQDRQYALLADARSRRVIGTDDAIAAVSVPSRRLVSNGREAVSSQDLISR